MGSRVLGMVMAALLLSACGSSTPVQTAPSDLPKAAPDQRRIEVIDESRENTNPRLHIEEYEWITFQAIDDADVTQRIVDDLNAQVSRMRTTFDARAKRWCKINPEIPGLCRLAITLKQQHIDANILAFQIGDYQDTGGAHGSEDVATFAYDAETGESFELGAQFVDLHTLRRLVMKALPEAGYAYGELIDDWELAYSILSRPNSYRAWMPYGDGVEFYFNAAEIASYADGPITLWMSGLELWPFLREGTPLWRYAGE